MKFIDISYSPYHAAENSSQILNNAGYTRLYDLENWELKKGGKYYFTKNNSTLIAFQIGNEYNPNNTGFKVLGAHTDSPCLRLNPVSKTNAIGLNQACVFLYGGGLWHTWFDRDLQLGGKVIYFDKKTNSYETTLFDYPKPVLKIPNLAIHLTPVDNRGKFDPNKETHIKPVFSSEIYDQLLKEEPLKQETEFTQKHYSKLIQLIAKQKNINPEDIKDFDIYLSDNQPSQLVGINEEFISSPRLDNLLSSFAVLKALTNNQINYAEKSSFVNLICLYDHEECGSESVQGAGSNLVFETMKRIFNIMASYEKDVKVDSFQKALAQSMQISADMAHAHHPNYQDKHQSKHSCQINKGIVIKTNYNQRYASDAVSASICRILAEQANVPTQDFVVKNDSPCGTTIGPITAAKTVVKTVDIGAPQWGMHSIRETSGVLDTYYYVKLFEEFLSNYEKISQNLLKL